MKKNNKDFELRYCDKRNFGKLKILTKNDFDEFSSKYGPEPTTSLKVADFIKQLTKKRTNIKNALLDQKLISGMGNVYANDALWIAQIHPETKTTDLSLERAEKLLQACVEILQEGIKHRGISMSDYVDLFGKKGQQQNHFRIYKKDTCRRCGTKTEVTKLNGRGTYYCPTCQGTP